MVHPEAASLPTELHIALSYTPLALRPVLQAALMLDQRLSRLVGQTHEPMLGQMRLAWWRDMLGKPVGDRPQGDAVLDSLGVYWPGRETALIALVDGWEHLLAEPPLREQAALDFAQGRAALFAEFCDGADYKNVISAARLWALTDAGIHISDRAERLTFARLAQQQDAQHKLPRQLRGLAVLRALSQRSLHNNLAPLMQGRGASLTALRAGFLGR